MYFNKHLNMYLRRILSKILMEMKHKYGGNCVRVAWTIIDMYCCPVKVIPMKKCY